MSTNLTTGVEYDDGGAGRDVESALSNVDGKVKNVLIAQIRKLVDKNPQAFVSNMRHWLHEGRSFED